EVARLAREAVVQARMNARGRNRRVELGPPPPPVSGEWRTPITRDPFTISRREKLPVLQAYREILDRWSTADDVSLGSAISVTHRRQSKTFASTDGAFATQTLYHASPGFEVTARSRHGIASRSSQLLQPRAGGWEVMAEAPLEDEIPQLIDEAIA